MTRYFAGLVSGCFAVLSALLLASIFMPHEPDVSTRRIVTPPLDPAVVADARAAFNEDLFKAAAPDLPVPEVSDEIAVASASFADAMRAATGDVPDPEPVSAPMQRSDNQTIAPTASRPNYFEMWDDMLARCYATVALHQNMDETGLTPKGDERVSYNTPDTEQTWFAGNKLFKIKVSIRKGYKGPAPLRTCNLKTNRFARVSEESLSQLFERFRLWWAKERYAQGTVIRERRYPLHKDQQWYGGQTSFGSVQGCPMNVEVNAITIANETEVQFFLTENEKEGCNLGAGSGAGGKVRINRLPQIKD
ncbi:hypothetical protein OS189_13425 [Sulfitobacter sp. F26169L]|uniref:hypothetical protein n=1 Tax=Sulfitobacter sp. F26169L TaxID=2996015 RepID=UPI002260BD15|nr:hypothetical protein [Sulfitobacter sp. F26169L]MCX7567347.1 hypothetical protein [Sulfitobacter sp. F26169L]